MARLAGWVFFAVPRDPPVGLPPRARPAPLAVARAGAAHPALLRHHDQQGGQAAARLPARPRQGEHGQGRGGGAGSGSQGRKGERPARAAPVFLVPLRRCCFVADENKTGLYSWPQVEVASKYSTVETLRQQYLFVPAKYKDCYLAYVLTGAAGVGRGTKGMALGACGRAAAKCKDCCLACVLTRAAGRCTGGRGLLLLRSPRAAPEPCSTPVSMPLCRRPPAELAGSTSIIFTRTCDSTRRLALTLRNLGFGAVPIHGQMSQPKRLAALNKFKARRRAAGGGGRACAGRRRGDPACCTQQRRPAPLAACAVR